MLQVLAQLLLDLDGAVATVTARHDGRMEACLRCSVTLDRKCLLLIHLVSVIISIYSNSLKWIA